LGSASDALAELFSEANLPAADTDIRVRDEHAEEMVVHPITRFPEDMGKDSPPADSATDPPGGTTPNNEPASAGQLTMLAETLSDSLGMPAEESQIASGTDGAKGPPAAQRDWAFEEKLASHDEWVKSQGQTGAQGDFSGAELEGAELIGANLRFADLHDAKLTAADLLLADLRDACLARANLEDCCLVGARLEGANLEEASLGTAMGLVPRQVAGANLRGAALPPDFLESIPTVAFELAAQAASRYLLAGLVVSFLSVLIVWRTRDAQLLTDSAIIPFLHSHTAAAALPTAEFYLILPVLLFTLYLLFHFHLQRLWDAVAESPAVFPTGQTLGHREQGLVGGLLRTHFPWIQPEASATRMVERGISLALAYWVVPCILVLFWARYLTRQDSHGTILHAVLVVVSVGVAVYATTRTGQAQDEWTPEQDSAPHPLIRKLRSLNPAAVALGCGAILLFLSAGTIAGVPHDRSRAPQYGPGHIRRWASSALWTLGLDPYADLSEVSISPRPANWTGADSELAAVRGPRLADTNFRYAQAYGAFLVNAHLLRADFEGAFLPVADLRGADLGQSNLRFAVLDQAQMSHVNLDRSNLEGADLTRADLRDANLSHASLEGAILVDARLEGASFYAARLSSATLTRANLARADLREAYADGARMEHADFRGAYLSSAKLRGANLEGAHLQNAIAIEASLRGADLRGAEFAGTVLTGADLSEANLDGADLRGASGLSASQVCSAMSRRWALLDDGLGLQVQAQCGK
jgi:uncharacterized protein YjbI with pentapeptide repeats